jgi:hypothetical protein
VVAELRRTLLAVGLALAVTPLSAARALAQEPAHEDEAWQQDRQPAYGGNGWRASQGGSPPLPFPSFGVDLRSWIPVLDLDAGATGANDCWGYVSASGREYALIGLTSGTAFVEVTDPDDAQLVDVIPGVTSDWRDIKTYQQFAYLAGLRRPDLETASQPDPGVAPVRWTSER